MLEARGGRREELPHAPMPEAKGSIGRSNPTTEAGGGGRGTNLTSKEPWLRGCRRA